MELSVQKFENIINGFQKDSMQEEVQLFSPNLQDKGEQEAIDKLCNTMPEYPSNISERTKDLEE